MKPRLTWLDYLLLPVVIVLFSIFAIITFLCGHEPEEGEDE